ALGGAGAGVRARLRGGQPFVAAQVRHRGAVPAHPALARGQARGRGRPARYVAGTRAMSAVAREPGRTGVDERESALERWFASRGWQVQDFQRVVWRAWREGRSGLVHAPTGSGKTLAAWG